MKRSIILKWFVGLFLFFAIANAAGAIRPTDLKPYRITGFPYTFMAWGTGIEEYFDWMMLGLDVAIAVICSFVLAVLLALARNNQTSQNTVSQST
jgi:hypothetical protein